MNRSVIGLDKGHTEKLIIELNSLLANFQVYYQNVRGLHWNIKGRNFFELHTKFEEFYTDAQEKVDLIAERILTLQGTPLHTFDDYVKLSTVKISKNISNNEGYDNQPSFQNEHTILFASTRNKQTDILQYNSITGVKKWLNDTKQGSEYSPTSIPTTKDFSAIRLDTTGLQHLYRYRSGKSKVLLKDLKIGYLLLITEFLHTLLVYLSFFSYQ